MKKYLALKASAGSGKTFALTVRYISLLLLGAKPSEILTLTFTNKAANEMSERIYKTILTLGDDEAYLNQIIYQSGLNKSEILGKKNQLVKSFCHETIAIFTIDKFINKILREFSGYIGISDDFEIKNDDIENLSMKFLQSLDEKQFEILIDFSLYENKKFNSIFELFKTILEKNEKLETINIEDSLITLQKEQVLKQALKIKEFIFNCDVASVSVKKAVSFENFEELFSKAWLEKNSLGEHSYFKKCANDILEKHFSDLKYEMGIYYKLRAGYSLNKLFELYNIFKEYKIFFNKSKNYLEFNDISNLVYELLTNKIDKDFLYFRLDSSFSHVLIDEFQDTSLLQYKILKPLIDEILSGDETAFKSFFYVGDTKQSIYRFRGGKRELFDYVANSYEFLEIESLDTNYRSCFNIIDFVNKNFLNLINYEYIEQKTVLKNGYVEVYEDKAFEEDDKYVNIASKIASLIKQGVNYNEIAILTYTNDDVLSLYYYLKQKFPTLKISTEMTSKLINQQNVKAVINALKYFYFKEEIYKENLNALIGNEILTRINFDINFEKKSVQEIVKTVAQNLKIVDENVIKFIDECGIYNNIVDFLYEVDKLDSTIENSETKGLQILTVFKSKGLEFHTVLILDRIKKKNPDRSTLLFDYDNIKLQNIFYKIKGYQNFNEDYANALEKEKKLSYEDELNILYVALTRAKNNMIIFKKEEKSVFDYLSLNACKIGELIQSESLSLKHEKIQKINYIPLSLGIQDTPIKEDKDYYENHLYSRYFGLATHYCLEMMTNFDKENLEYALKLSKSIYSNYLNEDDFIRVKNQIMLLLENDFFIKLLEDSQFISEQAVIYKEELKIIDLLLYKNETYYIVDYKTTKNKNSEHILQVKHYKKAISDIFKTNNVYGYLIYLNDNKIDIDEVI